ncbi:MAG: folate family ECF transporter S component [Lachnospiraceae bacterium]|nr:folate family ECF transporter S component [Lachnospiraceae bacterium]
MKRLATLFTQSYREIRQVRTITTCAMFAAISVVLGYFTIQLGNYIKIGFSGIANELVDYLFGPVVGGCFGGLLDVLKYLVKPTGEFFPGFTLNAVLAGFLYGSFFYKRPLTMPRILLAKLVVVMICNVGLSTLWLSMLYGKGFMVLLPARFIKNMIMWPIDSLILYTVGKALETSGVFRILKNPLVGGALPK